MTPSATGHVVEDFARRLAAGLGVSDFVYRPVVVPRGRSVAASATSMWRLGFRQPIDAGAVRRLLIARYGWATDDVPHDDPFLPSDHHRPARRDSRESQSPITDTAP